MPETAEGSVLRGPQDETVRLFVRDLFIEIEVGARPDERGRTQPLIVDLEATVQLPLEDSIDHAVDYKGLAEIVRDIGALGHFVLIETVASAIATACLADRRVRDVVVTVRKPSALPPALAGVQISRSQRL